VLPVVLARRRQGNRTNMSVGSASALPLSSGAFQMAQKVELASEGIITIMTITRR